MERFQPANFIHPAGGAFGSVRGDQPERSQVVTENERNLTEGRIESLATIADVHYEENAFNNARINSLVDIRTSDLDQKITLVESEIVIVKNMQASMQKKVEIEQIQNQDKIQNLEEISGILGSELEKVKQGVEESITSMIEKNQANHEAQIQEKNQILQTLTEKVDHLNLELAATKNQVDCLKSQFQILQDSINQTLEGQNKNSIQKKPQITEEISEKGEIYLNNQEFFNSPDRAPTQQLDKTKTAGNLRKRPPEVTIISKVDHLHLGNH